jgi:hypothetical protein
MEPMKKPYLKTIAFFIIGVVVGFGFSELYINCVQPNLTPKLSLDQMCENAIDRSKMVLIPFCALPHVLEGLLLPRNLQEV